MSDIFYLGIDYGTKKTGVAIAQRVTSKARPLKIIYQNYINQINEIILEWDIDTIIIGYPLNNGKEKKIHKDIKNFVQDLKRSIDSKIKIILYNEHYTSDLARNDYAQMRIDGLIKKKSDYDDISASIILQSWINENTMD